MPKSHYITEEEIQDLKKRVVAFKNYIRTQSTIARIAKADVLYKNLNIAFDTLEDRLNRVGNTLQQKEIEELVSDFQGVYNYALNFKAAVSGFQAPINQNVPDEPEGYAAEFFEPFQLPQTLDDILYFTRTQNSNFKRIVNLEKSNAEANQTEEQTLIREAEERTLIKGSQERLLNVEERDESGYGVLYDTITDCIRIIDADSDLQILAGDEYRSFKKSVEDWKQDIERFVKNGEFMNPEIEIKVVELDLKTEKFFENAQKHTHAFDELRALLRRECVSMRTAVSQQGGIAVKELLDHDYPEEDQDEVRDKYEKEAVNADMNAITSTYFTEGIQKKAELSELQKFANRFMMESEPYVHNGKTLIGAELRAELNKYTTFSFAEITRGGMEGTPLLTSLLNKGFTEEQLIKASKNPAAPENSAIMEVMKQTRKEILDTAMIDDVKEADDKLSDLAVETLGRLEVQIGELIKNPTNENIAAFSISSLTLKSFLEQGIPSNVYMENGEEFIRASVDRKLKEAGKAYTLDQIYGIVDALGYIGNNYRAEEEDGTVKVGRANTAANQIYFAKKFLNKIAKQPTTGEAIASFSLDFYGDLTSYHADDNDFREGKFYEDNKGVMKDTLYKLGIYNAPEFLSQMEAEREAHGASKRFLKVLDALKDVDTAQQRGFKQEYINEYFNELKSACNEYLDHRNPWKQEGKERYKLVSRIAAYVDASRTDRLNIAAEERAANGEPDTSFREINNNFRANTKPIFSDSDKMKAIKEVSNEIAMNQLRGMEIPADGGDVCWYKLIKTCAEYLADPDKADNARRDAVRDLVSRAIEAGHFNDPRLNRALAQAAPGAEGNRAEIMASLNAYETARDRRLSAMAAEVAANKNGIAENNQSYDDVVNNSMNVMRMYQAVENNVYVESVFGLNPQPEPEMLKEGVYTITEGVENYHADKIELTENAKNGLAAIGLTERDFANLAYMDLALNSYVCDGVTYKEKSEEAAIHVSGMVHENMIGSNFRKNMLISVSTKGNAFKIARNNIVSMLEEIGAGNPADLTKMGDLMGHMLKFLKPDLRNNKVDAYYAEQFYVKQIVKMAEAKPELMKAIADSGRITKQEYRLLKGVAENAELEKDAALARLKVVSAVRSGRVMPKQEMIDCYRAILKAGIIWTESKVLHADSQEAVEARTAPIEAELSQAYAMNSMMQNQHSEQVKLDPNSEATEALRLQVEASEKEINRLIACADAAGKTADVARPILTFIGSPKDRELFNGIVESMIPENITMQDLMLKANPSFMFKKEHVDMTNELVNQLKAKKAVPAEEKAKEHQEAVEMPEKAANEAKLIK